MNAIQRNFLNLVSAMLISSSVNGMPLISEFQAINDTVLADGDGDFSDWIEIHNSGSSSFDLGGHYLTDDQLDLVKWQFPSPTVIPAGGYLVVFASNKPTPPAGQLHTNFKLSGGGEFLALVDANGQTLLDSFSPTYPPQSADISYGRDSNDELRYFFDPTPGAVNVGGISDPNSVITFSPAAGTFTGTHSVALSNANPQAVIYYTTNGSDPTTSSTVYSAPLNLNSTTEIRAIAVVPGEDVGPINSESYIRLANNVVNFNSPHPLVILENFNGGSIPNKRAGQTGSAGDGSGITQVARQAAHMTIIDQPATGSTMLTGPAHISSRIGIRVRGASSTNQPEKHQNYSVESWGAVNEQNRDIAPFEMPADNDWVLYAPYDFDRALIRNTFAYEIYRRMGHYAVRLQYVEAFINLDGGDITMDDYAGVYVFMEKIKQSRDRIDVKDFAADGSNGGWMLEVNRMDSMPADGSGLAPRNFHTRGPDRIAGTGDDVPREVNNFINFNEPSGYGSTLEQRDAIENWFDDFENVLYGENWRDPSAGYRSYVDIPTFLDHFLLVDVTLNIDGMQTSTHMNLPDTFDKLHLTPVWDYDRSMDSYDRRDNNPTSLTGAADRMWYPRMFNDPEFAQEYIDRWQELRRGILSDASVSGLIADLETEITLPVAERNFARWNASNNTPRSGGWPAEVDHMEDWLIDRLAWFDGRYLAAPVISENAGQITLSNTDTGTIYYTLDGTDPRLPEIPITNTTLVAEGAPGRALIPTGPIGDSWRGGSEPFDDASWLSGDSGVGYGYSTAHFGIDVGAMQDVVGSAYLRVPFEVTAADLANMTNLSLNLKYEDGFVAYINGVQVASDNSPANLQWNSTTGGTTRNDALAIDFRDFDITAHLGLLKVGSNVLAIQSLNATVTSSDILCTPELVGSVGSSGGVAAQALTYANPFTLTDATKVTARLRFVDESNDIDRWSGPIDATFLFNTVPADSSNLVVSEIMYRPADASSAEVMAGVSDRDEFEYIELMNVSLTQTIDLSGVQFLEVDVAGDMQGIVFNFSDAEIQFLAPGERLILVENLEAFELRYGSGHPVAGQYSGALSNDGEQVTISGSNSNIIQQFTYNDQSPWPVSADGGGSSLTLISPLTNPDHGNPLSWVASVGGSPGLSGFMQFVGTASEDQDGDGLSALAEFALGTSDTDSLEGNDHIVGEFLDGSYLYSYTLNQAAGSVRVTPEVSMDLNQWSSDASMLSLVRRTENGDGTETYVWSPVNFVERAFIRLRVE